MKYELGAMSNDELTNAYYDSVLNCLGSICEDMYERGYDIVDIKEQEQLEREYVKYTDTLEKECMRRGIELWK